MINKNSAFGLLLLTFGLLMGMRYYVDHKLKQAPAIQEPLLLDATFIEHEGEKSEEKKTTIAVPYGSFTFSDKGAILTDMVYQREIDHSLQEFVLLSDSSVHEMSEKAFLVALNDLTPLWYEFEGVTEDEKSYTVRYKSKCAHAITKQFVVWKDKPQIDLLIDVVPQEATKVRVLWPSPLLHGLEDQDQFDAFFINQKGDFTKIAHNKVTYSSYDRPTMVGVEDKYFIFSMIADAKHQIQRSYFKAENRQLVAVLETEPISKESSFKFSFYCGPKQADTMALVDKRLEKTFDHGIFGFITKPLLKLLSWIYGLVHNYGIAILLVTLLIKLVTLPFTWTGVKKMRRLEEYQRKMDYIGKKYKDNKQAYEAARLELLEKEGFTLLASCLPLLIPVPFFVALQSGLNNSLELYRAPFFWWITDLSATDPYKVLPFILTIFFLISGFMNNKTSRQNITTLIMAAVMFGATSYASAGICLFIIANIGLHFLQTTIQKVIA